MKHSYLTNGRFNQYVSLHSLWYIFLIAIILRVIGRESKSVIPSDSTLVVIRLIMIIERSEHILHRSLVIASLFILVNLTVIVESICVVLHRCKHSLKVKIGVRTLLSDCSGKRLASL